MTQQVLTQTSQIKYPWLLGQKQDMMFFIAPAVIAYLVYAATALVPSLSVLTIVFTVLYAVNVLHQAATYFHYCDKRNRSYYFGTTKQRVKFIVLPLAIFIASVVGGFVYFQLVAAVWLIWGIPHVVQQNLGIMLLYHNPRSGEAIVRRSLEMLTIRLAAFFFVGVSGYRNWLPCARDPAFSAFYLTVIGIFFLAFVTSVVMYLLDLRAQLKSGATLNAPALFFWVVCITFYMPLSVTTNALALLIPSVLHWIQYIGLNYVMVQRKYSGEQAEFLSFISSEQPLNGKVHGVKFFVYFCLSVLVVQYGLYLLLLAIWPQANFMNTWNSAFIGLGMVHYLLDGFIWKFREEHNRKAILPYLVSRN